MRHRVLLLGRIEGLSLLLLLLVAMPMKYLAGLPQAVQVVGWIHGLLFIAFVLLVVTAWRCRAISLEETCWAGVTSVLPFGFLVWERRFRSVAAIPAVG
ncbi:MAG: DUF3817 domain-containing protein [Planctomycetota bacterium]